jgi:hypothetical protein
MYAVAGRHALIEGRKLMGLVALGDRFAGKHRDTPPTCAISIIDFGRMAL